MEELVQKNKSYALDFQGDGKTFFGIIIVNWLLTIITLGIYYPWAKAKKMQFLYGNTTLNDDNFSFHGTGEEMLKGFLKSIVLFGLLFGLFGLFSYLEMPIVGILVLYLGIFAVLPLAIHGSYRYRMSRTSWRGIRFGYRGDLKELYINCFKWIGFTIITFGFYGSWMAINLRKYVLGNIRFGEAEFEYEGDGGDFLLLNIKGYLFTIFTLGIYFFWWQKELLDYYINNLTLNRDDKQIRFESTLTGGDLFKLTMVNILILVFTLGLGYAWVTTRTMKFVFQKIELEGNIDLDNLHQTEENFKDATGEDLNDLLDMDFVI